MLTAHQKKALDFQRHLSVTANAGAGKTTVLVQRFVDILQHTNTHVNELVAITFTEKAAGELKKKIADLIKKKIRHASTLDELQRLEQIRDQLPSANIGTIHSFCAGILREFPVEADVDASFTVLEGVDQQILEQQSLRETFELMLGTATDSLEREKLLSAIRMLGRTMVQDYLTVFLRKREQMERLLRSGGCLAEQLSDKEILKRWNDTILHYVVTLLDDSQWIESLLQLLQVANGKKASVVKACLEKWNINLDPKSKISLYREIVELVYTKSDTLRKDFIGSSVDLSVFERDETWLSEHQQSLKELITVLQDPQAEAADKSMLQLARTLLKIYQKIVETYDLKKFENCQLDFEDLQLKALNVLQRDEVRIKLAEKYKFIMVDEYQDTNRLQYEILKLLISNFQTGNLFIVGDPKQSIYGFRNAEVEMFEAAKNDIAASAKELLPFRWNDGEIQSDHEERKGRIHLAESFRLLSNLVAFVNRIFSRTMTSSCSQFDVHYDELVKGRANAAPGTVELLLVPTNERSEIGEDGKKDDDFVAAECKMIAERILDLVQTQQTVYNKDEQPRPFQYGDAAILLRSRTHLPAVEWALSMAGIPYILSGGIGFYQTQEVFDFLNYFKFLLNLQDDVALIGVLRSPFFAISDAELFEISLRGADEPFWVKFERYVSSQGVTSRARRAYDSLLRHLEQANRLSIPFLVQNVFKETGWRGTVEGLTFGGQRAANIEKLLRIAREFEGRGLTTLFDFVQRLNTLVEEEEREGQASVDITGSCVQVMTIHAAKGLEFPVVFLPFAHKKFHYDGAPFVDPDYGIGFNIKDEQNFDEEITPPFCQFLRYRSRAKTEAEEKRVFYVACTRARDMLLISGQISPSSKYVSYLQWIMEGLNLDATSFKSGEIRLFPSSIKVFDSHHLRYEKNQHELTITIRMPEEKKSHAPSVVKSHDGVIHLAEVMIEPLRGQSSHEFFSATQIKTFLGCPTKYFLKYHLGLPEDKGLSLNFDEEDEPNDKIFGELVGSLTHALLECIWDNATTDDQIRTKAEGLAATKSILSTEQQAVILEAVVSNTLSFKHSLFGTYLLSHREVRTEYSLSAVFGDDFLTGTIDLLYKNDFGLWCIVDYKTDNVTATDLTSRAELYKPQLAFYAFLVQRFFHQKTVNATVFFLRHPASPVHYYFEDEDILAFEKTIKEAIGKIKIGNFERNVARCDSCTYQRSAMCFDNRKR